MSSRLQTRISSTHCRWTLIGEFCGELWPDFQAALARAKQDSLPVVWDLSACRGLGLGGRQMLAQLLDLALGTRFYFSHCSPALAQELGFTAPDPRFTRTHHAEDKVLSRAFLRHAKVVLWSEDGALSYGSGWFLEVTRAAALLQCSDKLLAGRMVYALQVCDGAARFPVSVRHAVRNSDAWRIGLELKNGAGREILDAVGAYFLAPLPDEILKSELI